MSYKDVPEEIPVPVPRHGTTLAFLNFVGFIITVLAWVFDSGRIANGFIALYWLFVCGFILDSWRKPKP